MISVATNTMDSINRMLGSLPNTAEQNAVHLVPSK